MRHPIVRAVLLAAICASGFIPSPAFAAQDVLPATPIRAAATALVALTAPLANAQYLAPADIALTATVVSYSVMQVEFFANGTLVGSTRVRPYAATWTNVPPGTYSLVAVWTNTQGTRISSAPVSVVVKGRDLPLVQKASLRRLGAFRVPSGTFGGSSFGYNGPIAYNPARGSLFMVGHDWQQFVAEIAIPEVRSTTTVGALAVANVLQPFADPTRGRSTLVNPRDPNAIKVGGMLPWKDKLIVSSYAYYDGSSTQVLSHFVAGQDLATPTDVQGPFQLTAPKAGFVAGYMAPIPAVWQAVLGATAVTGQCCIPVVSRTSFGPSLFAFNPADVGVASPVPTAPLVYYPEGNQTLGNWGTTSGTYNGSSKITAVAFPDGSRSVLFFGRHGLGTFCYGNGTECKDPMFTDTGVHAYPYVYQVWAYDANELVEVRKGARQPWSVRPYATWQLELPTPSWSTSITGATYDAATGRLFISQGFVDGGLPLIHVFAVDLPQ